MDNLLHAPLMHACGRDVYYPLSIIWTAHRKAGVLESNPWPCRPTAETLQSKEHKTRKTLGKMVFFFPGCWHCLMANCMLSWKEMGKVNINQEVTIAPNHHRCNEDNFPAGTGDSMLFLCCISSSPFTRAAKKSGQQRGWKSCTQYHSNSVLSLSYYT